MQCLEPFVADEEFPLRVEAVAVALTDIGMLKSVGQIRDTAKDREQNKQKWDKNALHIVCLDSLTLRWFNANFGPAITHSFMTSQEHILFCFWSPFCARCRPL